MAYLVFSTKDLVGYRLRVEQPIRPFALNYLAASGLFDRLCLETDSGVLVTLEGADLLKAADVVGVRDALVDTSHCTDPNVRIRSTVIFRAKDKETCMKPTIGRIVHYRLIDTGKIIPAIVVDVPSDDHVDLFVMSTLAGAADGGRAWFERGVRRGFEGGRWEWPSRAAGEPA